MRDVETASERIAARKNDAEFTVSLSRLFDIESKGVSPTLHRLYSLSVIYRRDMREILSWCGIDLAEAEAEADSALASMAYSDVLHSREAPPIISTPPLLKASAYLSQVVAQWGTMPLAYLFHFANSKYAYGYIGSEDFTMYPLLMPGSFVEIDESVNVVSEEKWSSQHEGLFISWRRSKDTPYAGAAKTATGLFCNRTRSRLCPCASSSIRKKRKLADESLDLNVFT